MMSSNQNLFLKDFAVGKADGESQKLEKIQKEGRSKDRE
jgi:hypothetical protein